MKDLIKTWERFLKEGAIISSSVLPEKFTGIIQIKPSGISLLQGFQDKILEQFPDQKPITKLHVTLLHQAIPKKVQVQKYNEQGELLAPMRGDKALKAFFKSDEAKKLITPPLDFGEIGIKTENDRISTYIKIDNPSTIRAFLETVLTKAGLNIEEVIAASMAEPREAGRIFHISLTNLTGNPGDSIANINGGTEINI